jgi:hypothetical protein
VCQFEQDVLSIRGPRSEPVEADDGLAVLLAKARHLAGGWDRPAVLQMHIDDLLAQN